MRASEFEFALPVERIAQQPAARRDAARLYVLPRVDGEARHATISDLPGLLPTGAVLAINDTRVIPARLRARKLSGGKVELLLLRPVSSEPVGDGWREIWRCIWGASKALRLGQILVEGERPPAAEVLHVEGAEAEVAFRSDEAGGLLATCERLGEVPLPPYITRDERPGDGDRERYQTVFAREPGAVAAPTAGLHFTPELLAQIADRGVEVARLTLHVGPGTFAAFRSDDVDSITELHAERFAVPPATAEIVNRAVAEGRPVIAVGTTSVRTLETLAGEDGRIRAAEGETRLFIRPGHRFRVVTGMLTNFHLPRSSLLMLVAAFAGRPRILAAYADAVARGYRFYSYGDAMLIS